VLGALLAAVGCFKPNIANRGYKCGDGGACPDNFTCDKPSGVCVQNGTATGGAGGKAGQGGEAGQATGGTTGTGGQAGMDAGVDHACLDPIASCQPTDAGLCDPVCNTGCGQCYEKCATDSTGALMCNSPCKTINGKTVCPPPAGTQLYGVLQLCDQFSIGSKPTDDCAPGETCIQANNCGNRCYKYCRNSNDCTNGASCSKDAGGGNTLCDVPPVACDPVNGAARTSASSGCPGTTWCYLSGTSNTTLCDCQNIRTDGKNGSVGDVCVRSRDCFGGLVCLDPTGSSTTKNCYKVCRLPNSDGGVPVQSSEQPCSTVPCSPILLPNGMTNPTYGFCNE
jgi:hypothetical protein